jgi:dTDP-4-amino-4,6-dideoxygalactose transaminase
MTDIQAAMGLEQLKRLPDFIAQRHALDAIYHETCGDIPWLALPTAPANTRPNWQSYPVRVLEHAPMSRNDIMQTLLEQGIMTKPGIMNAHQYRPYQSTYFDLRESDAAREQVILLPMYHHLQRTDIERIAAALHAIA